MDCNSLFLLDPCFIITKGHPFFHTPEVELSAGHLLQEKQGKINFHIILLDPKRSQVSHLIHKAFTFPFLNLHVVAGRDRAREREREKPIKSCCQVNSLCLNKPFRIGNVLSFENLISHDRKSHHKRAFLVYQMTCIYGQILLKNTNPGVHQFRLL